jgi:hypothetical protein
MGSRGAPGGTPPLGAPEGPDETGRGGGASSIFTLASI